MEGYWISSLVVEEIGIRSFQVWLWDEVQGY